MGTVYALTLARHIGTDLTPAAWLAGQFDGLAQWWHSLGPGQKLLVGAGVAALVGLSGGSLGLALGLSGAFTYVAEHGAGAADFTRDPVAATRSWLSTTTPAGAALDLAEFGLTFAPGNFAGAAAGRGLRAAIREYADDPAAFWAARRAWLADSERGSIDLSQIYGLGVPKITDAGLSHSYSRHAEQWFGRTTVDATDRPVWRSLVERATRSRKVVEWRTGNTDTYLHLARLDDGRYFAVQFHRTTHELVTAFVPNQGQLGAILGKLKA